MVHKKYKWNLSKQKGRKLIFNMISDILKERKNQCIHIDELGFLLNIRTKKKEFLNNNKKKNIHNFIKTVYGGLVQFLDDYDEFMLRLTSDGYIVELNNIETNEWIFVDNIK